MKRRRTNDRDNIVESTSTASEQPNTTTSTATTSSSSTATSTAAENMYTPLPSSVPINISSFPSEYDSQRFVRSLISELLPPTVPGQSNFDLKLKNRIISFDKPNKVANYFQQRSQQLLLQETQRKRRLRVKAMTRKQRKSLGIYDLPIKTMKYEMFLPLNHLWNNYIHDLFNTDGINTSLSERLLKADYHGALIHVIRSKCPTLIGISGIIIQETQEIFRLITINNQIKIIRKRQTVFCIDINNFGYELFGSHLCFRSSERTVKKFKSKPTIQL